VLGQLEEVLSDGFAGICQRLPEGYVLGHDRLVWCGELGPATEQRDVAFDSVLVKGHVRHYK
jgi:hypothetical protein